MTQFGQVNWDESSYGSRSKVNAKDLFLRLDNGDNKVRLITLPYQYSIHRVKVDDKDKIGQKVNCSQAKGSCVLCDEGNKAKPRWFIGVLSRKDGKTKILDMSYSVFDAIRKLAKNEDWGDPMNYDLNIVVDRQGGATGYYSVQPTPKKPLTADEQLLKDRFDIDELTRRVTPPEPSQVKARLEKLYEVSGGKAPVKSSDDEEEDDSFPSFEDS